jgi:hypothetical protein
MQRVLLTFVGFHDPTYPGTVAGEEVKGPILYLLGIRPFDWVYLFSAANTRDIAEKTAAAVGASVPGTRARIVPVDIDDPIDYLSILAAIRRGFEGIRPEHPGARFFISTASGTPQMHAAWLLLASSSEVPAVILQTRPPRFVTTDRPAVEEVDLGALRESAQARAAPGVEEVGGAAVPAGPRAEEPGGAAARAAVRVGAGAGLPLEELALEELGIVGRHPAFREALDRAARFARSPLPVLIQGETGTGKELVARYIHRLSGLPADRLQAVNCAALPRELAESLLFGYRKGAFTGASQDRRGAFELASGGTLFLDEVSELHLEVQAKLLRVLQDGIVQPLGAEAGRKVDVRLLAATNRDLRALVAEKAFREDLFYRLEVGIVRLPALRERASDIPLLSQAALQNANSPASSAQAAHPGRPGAPGGPGVAGQRAGADERHGAIRAAHPRGRHRCRGSPALGRWRRAAHGPARASRGVRRPGLAGQGPAHDFPPRPGPRRGQCERRCPSPQRHTPGCEQVHQDARAVTGITEIE